MEIEYSIKTKDQLTRREYKQLYFLNFGHDGMMRSQFAHGTQNKFICIAKENDIVVGWGLVFEYKLKDEVYMYVRKKCRRNGIGTNIIAHIKQHINKKLIVDIHDTISFEFYKKQVRTHIDISIFDTMPDWSYGRQLEEYKSSVFSSQNSKQSSI